MSGIVLSASVRQNLLSLQSTADLLATTQNRLATGKKVNSALDNPTNFFTAASLDNRASDINNLLDGIGNGVQVLQAANTGISSLQKLVDSAKSVATQALQATVGYAAKSSVSVSINGATASNLLGTGAPIDATFTGSNQVNNQSVIYSSNTGIGGVAAATHQNAYTDATSTGTVATGNIRSAYTSTAQNGGVALQDSAAANATASTSLDAAAGTHLASGVLTALSGQTLTINGNTVTFNNGTTVSTVGSNTTIGLGSGTTATLDDIRAAVQTAAGGSVTVAINAGRLDVTTGTTADFTVTGGAAATALGLATVNRGGNVLSTPQITGATVLSGTATAGGSAVLSSGFSVGNTVTVNGQTLTFVASGASGANQINVTDTVTTLLSKIDGLSGGSGSSVTGGAITLHTGTTADLAITSNNNAALTALGLGTGVTQARGGGATTSAVSTSATLLNGTPVAGSTDALASGLTTADYLIVNNKTITFHAGNGNTGTIAGNNFSIGLGNGTIADVLSAIQSAAPGSTATVDGTGHINLATGTTSDISLVGSLSGTLTKLGLGSITTVNRTAAATPAITSATALSGASTSSSDALTSAFGVGDTITVNGQNLTFVASGAADNNHINVTDTIGNLLTKIDVLSGNTGVGATPSSVTGGHIVLHTGASSDLTISSSNAAALGALGLGSGVSQARGTGPSQLNGLTLSIGATGGGTATNVTFGGSGLGHVNTLNELNAALASNNLQATLAQNGTLTITTTNDAASATIGTIGGTAAASGQLFFGVAGSAPVVDTTATSARNALVDQYNNILNQITTTAQDASFNGVNLLTGDTLKLTFNETGKSTLSIAGVNFNAAGLGLATLQAGDFKDNSSVQKVVSGLQAASSTLRSQASAFGSNLSIVQIRQDFSKNLINVLQTGSSNLTLADTNEEAANSQALSTRQSIAVSALALANQSQQSVLQLLR